MQPGLLIRLRPLGAWRYGPSEGGHDSIDTLYRSDRLYSAITLAMQRLGYLDEWLDVTVRTAKPAVVFSSLYPFQGDTLYAIPPTTLWPPPPGLLHSPSPVFLTKIRWKTARFVPLSVIDSLITGQPILADQWLPDPESGCLLRRDRPSASPFRTAMRSTAAVDRLTRTSDESKPVACVEFEPSAGLWTVARFADAVQEQIWSARLQAALRLLSDSGFGGGRSKGWGQTETAEFQPGAWPALLLPKLGRLLRTTLVAESTDANSLFWLLSLYSPAAADKVDWSGGNYSLSTRGGHVESQAGPGVVKKTVRMVGEGCVLASHEEPVGAAVDVAPDGFAHPVYRSGLALALRLPVVEVQAQEKIAIEEPSTAEAVIESEIEAEPTVAFVVEHHVEAEEVPVHETTEEPPPAPTAEAPPALVEHHIEAEGLLTQAVESVESAEETIEPPAEEPPPAPTAEEPPAPVEHIEAEALVTQAIETIEPAAETIEPPAAIAIEPPTEEPPPTPIPEESHPAPAAEEPPAAPLADETSSPPSPAEPVKDEEAPHEI